MEAATRSSAVTINPAELENLIRRAVKDAVHEEFRRVFHPALLEYLVHEGPEDPAGDEELLAEALAMIERYKGDRTGWKTLEEFEAGLAQRRSSN